MSDERVARAIYERIVHAGEPLNEVLADYLPDEMLADPESQRRLIEGAERRGYKRAIKERIESAETARVLDRASGWGHISCVVPPEWIGRRVALVLLEDET